MKISRNGSNQFTITCPAKVNLFLEVLGRRSDGYHEVETVLCPLQGLEDELHLEASSGLDGIDFKLLLPAISSAGNACSELANTGDSTDPAWQIPSGSDNLVVRAVQMVLDRLGSKKGIAIRLCKRIPAGAGLGGGSSNAASAVVGTMLALGCWDRSLAESICSSIGSDVAFFLGDRQQIGLALATGRGEQCQQIACPLDLRLAVTHPPAQCSTAAIYQLYASQMTSTPKRSAKTMIEACQENNSKKVGRALFNALQLPASSTTNWIDVQLKCLAQLGVVDQLMTGSGSACFGLLPLESELNLAHRFVQLGAGLGLRRTYCCKNLVADAIEAQI